jgi:hypothetical protein
LNFKWNTARRKAGSFTGQPQQKKHIKSVSPIVLAQINLGLTVRMLTLLTFLLLWELRNCENPN